MKRILIFAVHPDDELLSFGGYIHDSIKKGDLVKVHIFACGGPRSNVSNEVRYEELKKVTGALGLQSEDVTADLGMDGLLDSIPNMEITTVMDSLIEEFKPDELFCNMDSHHSDHHAVYKAFLAAIRLKSGFMPNSIYLGEYPFSLTQYAPPVGGRTYYAMSEETLLRKVEIFEMYKSQLKPSPSPLGENGIRILAETRGLECGKAYAECFYNIRTML